MVSQINYTITNYADHHPENISHDRINRYIKGDKLKPRLVWEQVKQDIVADAEGYLLFDDTVLDKDLRYSPMSRPNYHKIKIELGW